MPLDLRLTDTRKKKVKLALYGALWLLWALIPVVALVALMWGPPGLLALSTAWQALVGIWVGSLLVLFVWMLRWAVSHSASPVMQWKLGTLCTLSLALPVIFVTAVPLVPINIRLLQQRFAHGNIVDLRSDAAEAPRAVREPNVYVVGIDVSDTFLRAGETSADPEVPHAERTIDLVTRTILDLFGEQGILGQRWQRDDILTIWTFAGGEARSLLATNGGSPWEKDRILRRLHDGMLRDQLSERPAGPAAAGTNVLGFFDTALDELPTSYHQAKVIVFSDLHHLEPIDSCASPAERRRQIDNQIVKLAQRINGNAKLNVVAVRTGNPPPDPNALGRDVASRFNGLLMPEKWQSDDLLRFQSRDATEKQMQMLGLYDEVRDTRTIYLKYATGHGNRSIPSFLLLNAKTPRITVALRKRNPIRTDLQTPSNMRVTIGNGTSHCSIELDGAEMGAYDLPLLNDVGSSVPVRLDPGAGIRGEPRADLLVAMSPTTIYRIPISVLEVDDDEGELNKVLLFVLLALNGMSLVFAAHSYRYMRTQIFDKQDPASTRGVGPAAL